MSDIDPDLFAIFRDEVSETLDELAIRLERLQAGAGDDLQESIDSAFRNAHNLKGAARMVGQDTVVDLTHTMEDTLSPFRDAGEAPPPPVLAAMIEALTVIEQAVDGRDVTEIAATLVGKIRLNGDGVEEESTSEPTPAAKKKRARKKKAKPKPVASEAEEPPEEPVAETSPGVERITAEAGATVRVEIDRLDRLMAYTGELLATHARQTSRGAQYAELNAEFRSAYEDLPAELATRFQPIRKHFEQMLEQDRRELRSFGYLTEEIGTAMKRVRMMPLSGVAPQWRRIVREATLESGHSVNLSIDVGAIELDKRILDNLRDPLMHLLRNAVGHGIEPRAERAAAGKPENGEIRVRATMLGARVQLEVSDDGRGLSADRIGEKAVERGLVSVTQLEQMTPDQVLHQVFKAGFSTAETVSELSGRGVGLDVVQKRVRDLGGDVSIAAPALGGSTFLIVVPVSLVSTRGLLVRATGATVALPIDHVERTLRVDRDSVSEVDGGVAIRINDSQPLKIRWLSPLMGEEREQDPDKLTVVVVSRENARMGLVVSEVLGEEEFVTKRLPWNLKQVGGVNGAVILGDGTLAVVIDVAHLFHSSGFAFDAGSERVNVAHKGRLPRVLVVDDSLTSRTLERNILQSAGYEVVVATDGEEGWETLQHTSVDLVVSDVEMPRCTGLELAARIRASETLGELPLILVTSLASEADLTAGAKVGADEYIVKGRFDQRQLLDAVARLV